MRGPAGLGLSGTRSRLPVLEPCSAHEQREAHELVLELVQRHVMTGPIGRGGGARLGRSSSGRSRLNPPGGDGPAGLLVVGDVRAGLIAERHAEMPPVERSMCPVAGPAESDYRAAEMDA